MAEKQLKKSQTRWHELLGTLLLYLLKPLGIEVKIGFPATKEIPKGDILLLRAKERQWTEAQYAVLPDGVRDSGAKHLLKWFSKQEEDQKMTMIAPSKEEILTLGKMWEDFYFDALTLDTFLTKKRVSTEEVLSSI